MNPQSPIDEKARSILFSAYWSAKGWKSPREEPSPDDFAYAKSVGVMFDPETLTHDVAVQRIIAAKTLVPLEAASDGFVASLVSRHVHLRPALASWFTVQAVEPHPFIGEPHCAICGQFPRAELDFSSTNFARLKWGAVPRFFMVDHAFILERFAIEPRPSASDADRALLHELLSVADSMPADARARDLERAWRLLIRSSREERDTMIEILCSCGVLVPTRRTPADYRRIPPKSNWTDDPALWRGDDGVHREQASVLFGSP